jgi:hypothetical protein
VRLAEREQHLRALRVRQLRGLLGELAHHVHQRRRGGVVHAHAADQRVEDLVRMDVELDGAQQPLAGVLDVAEEELRDAQVAVVLDHVGRPFHRGLQERQGLGQPVLLHEQGAQVMGRLGEARLRRQRVPAGLLGLDPVRVVTVGLRQAHVRLGQHRVEPHRLGEALPSGNERTGVEVDQPRVAGRQRSLAAAE